MAFNPERLALVVEPIGGVGLRWFNYQTDETEADLTTADYLPNAEKYGLRAYDLFFVSPASGVEEPYILVVDSIDADGNATLVKAKDELDRLITKTEAEFDKVGSLFQYGTPAVNAGVMIEGDLTETRDISKSVLHLELLDTGSGLVSDAHRGHALSASTFKRNFPDLALAEDGEMDTVQLTFRQSNGDACNILGNGVINSGYGGFFEATTSSLLPAPGYGINHSVSVSCAIVNDTSGGEYGYVASKTYATGGTGVLVHSFDTGIWDYGLQVKSQGIPQLEQRETDAALIIYEYGSNSVYYQLKVVSGVMTLLNNSDAIGVFATAASTNYTPTVTDAAAGAPTTATITGRWMKKSEKVRQVSIRAVMTDIGTLSGAWRFSLPADVTTDSRYFSYWTGENNTTGALIRCRVQNSTGYVYVTDAAGTGAPATSGQNIQFSVEYETV